MVIAIFKNYICHFLLTGKNICKMPYSMNAFQDSPPESHQLSRSQRDYCSLWIGRKEMFYLTMHSTHLITVIWCRTYSKGTIQIVREETRCCHMGYSLRLAATVLLYAPSHRQDSTYHGLCSTNHGELAGMKNSSMGPP